MNTVRAISHINEAWVYEAWWFEIKTEWWTTYKVKSPIEVKYKNENLTGFSPTLSSKTAEAIKLTEAKPGEIKVAVTSGAKVEVQPKVEIQGEERQVLAVQTKSIKAFTSHKNLKYMLKVNGETIPLSPIIGEDGGFEIDLPKLDRGNNTLELYYAEGETIPTLADTVYLVYRPVWWRQILSWISTLL